LVSRQVIRRRRRRRRRRERERELYGGGVYSYSSDTVEGPRA